MVDGPIRVMVVHTSPIVRAGVAAMLSRGDDIHVVATANDAASAHRGCVDLDVDVIVTSLPAADGGSGTAGWFDRLPDRRAVVLTDAIDEALVGALSATGVAACLDLATVNDRDLAAAVRGTMHGQATFSSEFLADIVHPRHEPSARLTARENDILELVALGHTNESIADILGLATGTVRIYVSTILNELQAPNRTAAAVVAIRSGLVAPGHGQIDPR
jgi:NarL family two-component system response regulator LiaR